MFIELKLEEFLGRQNDSNNKQIYLMGLSWNPKNIFFLGGPITPVGVIGLLNMANYPSIEYIYE